MKAKAEENRNNFSCSFCGKSREEVHKLVQGPNVYICNECIKLCQDTIREDSDVRDPNLLEGKYIHELLRQHFSPIGFDGLVCYSFELSSHYKTILSQVVDEWLKENDVLYKFVGIGRRYFSTRHELSFSELWEHEVYPHYVGAVQYRIVNIDQVDEIQYLRNGLWLCSINGKVFTVFFDYREKSENTNEYLCVEMSSKINDKRFLRELLEFIRNPCLC